jgi:hypothetical protein
MKFSTVLAPRYCVLGGLARLGPVVAAGRGPDLQGARVRSAAGDVRPERCRATPRARLLPPQRRRYSSGRSGIWGADTQTPVGIRSTAPEATVPAGSRPPHRGEIQPAQRCVELDRQVGRGRVRGGRQCPDHKLSTWRQLIEAGPQYVAQPAQYAVPHHGAADCLAHNETGLDQTVRSRQCMHNEQVPPRPPTSTYNRCEIHAARQPSGCGQHARKQVRRRDWCAPCDAGRR